jgi:DNA-binding CsgD family transcriptional regulator
MGEGRSAIREEIDASWQRSAGAGLTPDRFDVPFTADVDTDLPLVRAAGPVIDGLADDLGPNRVSVVLTDDQGYLLDRRVADKTLRSRLDRISLAPGFAYGESVVGTNAIGTALEQRRPSFVDGREHFAEALTAMVCAAAPIVDPQNGHVLGAVDLSCRVDDGSPLMLALATRAAREIESRLVDDSRVAERVALQRFLRARRGAKAPLVFVNERTMIANAAADRLVRAEDEAALWDGAARSLGGGHGDTFTVTLAGGTPVTIRCEPVLDGGTLLGALLQLRPLASAGGADGWVRPFGWDSLTESERSVTALVSQGLTNVQVAERLFVSRYTVDFHLRAVFRKLDVTSRVDLTRLVVEREHEAPSLA